jgi:hypothetical protein
MRKEHKAILQTDLDTLLSCRNLQRRKLRQVFGYGPLRFLNWGQVENFESSKCIPSKFATCKFSSWTRFKNRPLATRQSHLSLGGASCCSLFSWIPSAACGYRVPQVEMALVDMTHGPRNNTYLYTHCNAYVHVCVVRLWTRRTGHETMHTYAM